MSREALGKRLERLYDALSREDFLANRGIGNEIGFYVFAYDPEHEPLVASYLPQLKARLAAHAGVPVLEFNLYRLLLDVLCDRGLLDVAFELERAQGPAELFEAVRSAIGPAGLIERIEAGLSAPHRLVFLTGVGAAYPLIRSHTVLNNLHDVVDKVPLVMFFPGSYDGQELRLFNELKDDNYYRAFPLLPAAPESL